MGCEGRHLNALSDYENEGLGRRRSGFSTRRDRLDIAYTKTALVANRGARPGDATLGVRRARLRSRPRRAKTRTRSPRVSSERPRPGAEKDTSSAPPMRPPPPASTRYRSLLKLAGALG